MSEELAEMYDALAVQLDESQERAHVLEDALRLVLDGNTGDVLRCKRVATCDHVRDDVGCGPIMVCGGGVYHFYKQSCEYDDSDDCNLCHEICPGPESPAESEATE